VCITADHSLGQHETRDAAISDRARRLALAVCLAAGFTTLLDSSILSHGTARPSARGTGLALGLCATLVLLSLAISLRRTSTAARRAG
jgi:hypothetical protein